MKHQYGGIIRRAVMSLALMAGLFLIIDRDALLQSFAAVDPALYLLGLGAFVATILFWTLRWYLFVRATQESITYPKALLTLLTGLFYSMFLPTIVGTDVGRMYELGREQDRRAAHVVSSVLLDRLMGLITLCLLAVVALIIGSQFATDTSIVLTVIGAGLALIVGWVVFFNRRFRSLLFRVIGALPVVSRLSGQLEEVYDALYQLHNQPRLLLATGTISLLNSISETLAALLAARALGIEVDAVYFFIFMPLIWLVTFIPISISGLGLREGAFAFFFAQVGVPAADAIAISLLFYSYNVILGVLGGLLLTFSSLTQTRKLWKTGASKLQET